MIGSDLRFRTHSSGCWVWTGRREVMGRWGQEGQLGLLQWTSEDVAWTRAAEMEGMGSGWIQNKFGGGADGMTY